MFNNDNDDLQSITNGSINNDLQSPMKQTFYSAAGRSPSPKGKVFSGFSMAKKQGQPPLPAGKGIPPIKNVRITMIRQLKENDMVSKLRDRANNRSETPLKGWTTGHSNSA